MPGTEDTKMTENLELNLLTMYEEGNSVHNMLKNDKRKFCLKAFLLFFSNSGWFHYTVRSLCHKIPGGSVVKNCLPKQETQVWSLVWANPLKKEMSTIQYSCLGNPMDRSLVGYSIWGCKRVGHDLATEQQSHPPPETSNIMIDFLFSACCQWD